MRKRIALMVLCGALTLAGNAEIFAADASTVETNDISPCMDGIDQLNVYLQINSAGNAEFNCYVRGYSGTTTCIEISAKLQKYVDGKWITLKTFTASSDSYSASLNDSCKVSKGYTYRVRANRPCLQ